MTTTMCTDITIQNEGSIYLVRDHSNAGRDWMLEHLQDAPMTWGEAVVVEHRYILDIVAGMRHDGLIVRQA